MSGVHASTSAQYADSSARRKAHRAPSDRTVAQTARAGHPEGLPPAESTGLSLRAKLLLLQIAVTAVFLLIMGIVSTALFAQHLRTQFHATILAESTRRPSDI